MAKTDKKVSINALDKVVEERYLGETVERWYDIDIKIKINIPFTETLAFVDDVVSSCFQKNGAYLPEAMNFAINSNIISRYTNVSLPDNLEHRYTILNNTTLVDFVCGHINNRQLKEITTAIEQKLAYLCETNIADVQSRIEKLVNSFEEMQKQTEALFKDIKSEDIQRIASAIGESGLSEEKIVKAFINEKYGKDGAEPAEQSGDA